MEDSPGIKRYRALQKKRLEVLRKHRGADSEKEDEILDEMDGVWWELSESEQEYVRQVPGSFHDETLEWLEKAETK